LGSGCGQALPGVPRKAPLCLCGVAVRLFSQPVVVNWPHRAGAGVTHDAFTYAALGVAA